MSQRRTFADQSFSLVFGGLTLLGLLEAGHHVVDGLVLEAFEHAPLGGRHG